MDEHWQLQTDGDGFLFIATPGDVVCLQDRNREAKAEDEADAKRFRLIAAAPDLLAALVALESVVKYAGLPIQGELEDARAAIAKATAA